MARVTEMPSFSVCAIRPIVVYGFSAQSAEKPYTKGRLNTMLPHAKSATLRRQTKQLRNS
jgi:hypothetical protein